MVILRRCPAPSLRSTLRPPISFSALQAQLIGRFWSFLIHSNLPVIAPPTSSTPLTDRVGPDTAAGSGAASLEPEPAEPALEPLEPLEAAGAAFWSLGDFEQATRSENTT